MFQNYLKIAFRNIMKHKIHAAINIFGLAIGMACCMLILFYVQDELSYDRFHEDADRIHRVVEIVKSDNVGEESASNPFPLGPTLLQDFPDMVEESVRFFNYQAPTLAVRYEDQRFNEKQFFFADEAVFNLFTYQFLQGNRKTALAEPYSVVLTQSAARKYFGNENPLGKILTFENQHDFKVTGVLANVPANSHFQFDFLAAFSSLETIYPGGMPQGWYWNPCWTYVKLKEGVQPASLEALFPPFVKKYFHPAIIDKTTLYLQPLTDIHLHSHLDYEIAPNSDISYVYIFSIVAIFILLIACINFMNLATARSANRAKEVGMRKMMGAQRGQLIKQFLGESLMMSIAAMILSLVLIELTLPAFNMVSGKDLSLLFFLNSGMVVSLLSVTMLVGIGAGIYPAFFLSGFQPVKVLKGSSHLGRKGGTRFRSTLVVTQFVISIALIVGTIISYQQLDYMRNERLGFNKDEIVMIPIFRTTMSQQYEAFTERILRNPDILNVSATEDVVGAKYQTATYQPEGLADDRPLQFPRLFVQFDFAKTFDIEVISGRDFSRDFPADSLHGIIINETAAKFVGWTPEEAIGKSFRLNANRDMRVVGVIRDFNFASLHQPLRPFVLDMPNNHRAMAFFIRYVAVRMNMSDIPGTLAFLEETWNEFNTGKAFEFFFLDDELNKLYQAEERLGQVFVIFSCLAILVACLGLFALASFTAEQRTKEIGVRKVLGATVPQIIILLSREFTKLVIIAFLIAAPIAYFVMSQWLTDFAYRIDIRWWVFPLAGLISFAVALCTVAYQAVKASLANPLDAIRYE